MSNAVFPTLMSADPQILLIAVVNDRIWRSVQDKIAHGFVSGDAPPGTHEHVITTTKAVFDRLRGSPAKVTVPGTAIPEDGITSWLDGFAENYRLVIESLLLELAQRESRLFAYRACLSDLLPNQQGDL